MDRPPNDSTQGSTFLVERYWPGIDESRLRAVLPNLERAARDMRAEGQSVEHVGSILMPADQVVFTLIEAPSESVVREVNERAELRIDRISAAIQVAPEPIEVVKR
jgi:Nickel responsive protein SCO4226-like